MLVVDTPFEGVRPDDTPKCSLGGPELPHSPHKIPVSFAWTFPPCAWHDYPGMFSLAPTASGSSRFIFFFLVLNLACLSSCWSDFCSTCKLILDRFIVQQHGVRTAPAYSSEGAPSLGWCPAGGHSGWCQPFGYLPPQAQENLYRVRCHGNQDR